MAFKALADGSDCGFGNRALAFLDGVLRFGNTLSEGVADACIPSGFCFLVCKSQVVRMHPGFGAGAGPHFSPAWSQSTVRPRPDDGRSESAGVLLCNSLVRHRVPRIPL